MTEERDRQHISGERARQGEIILRTRAQRIVFIVGLAEMLILAIAFFAA